MGLEERRRRPARRCAAYLCGCSWPPQYSCPLAWPADAGQTARLDGRLDGWKVMQEAAGGCRPAHRARIGALPAGLAARPCQHATPSDLLGAAACCLHGSRAPPLCMMLLIPNSFCPRPPCTAHPAPHVLTQNTTPPFSLLLLPRLPLCFLIVLQLPAPPLLFSC